MLNTIPVYIPSEFCRILDMETLIYSDAAYHFSIIWEKRYLLRLDDTGLSEEIPDACIHQITESCTQKPSRAPYFINRILLPLKYQLIDKAQPSDRFMRIESVISQASGYAEKAGNILCFFGPDSIHIYPADNAEGIRFSLKDIVTASGQRQHTGDHISFLLYTLNGHVLQFQAVCEGTDYTVSSLAFCDTMQYLPLYQQQKTPMQIFQYHQNKNDTGLKRLFNKRL